MSKPSKRTLTILIAVLAIAWVSAVVFLGWTMRQPPEKFGAVMKHVPWPAFLVLPFETLWTHARAGTLQPGDAAPDFRLSTVDHSQEIQLSSLEGKQPVVLVFGSYT